MWMSAVLLVPLLPLLTSLIVVAGSGAARHRVKIAVWPIGAALGGAVVTESIFGMPGFGQFAAKSAERGDVPAVQGVLVVSIVLVVVFNLLVNVILARVTPASARGV